MRVFSVLAVLCVLSVLASSRVLANILGDTVDAINDFGCLAAVTTKSGKCLITFNNEVENHSKDTEEKVWCCAIRSFRDCVNTIAEQECNKDSEKVTEMVTESLMRGITSNDCANYGLIMCSTVIQAAIGAAVVIVLLTILTCCCCCCCCCCRRRRELHVQTNVTPYKILTN